jgi:group I intron endonuclease
METGIYDNRFYSVSYSGINNLNKENIDNYPNMGIYLISGLYSEISSERSICYVGSSINLYNRIFQAHYNAMKMDGCDYGSNVILMNAARKYGIDNFTFFLLEEIKEEVNLINREQNWIDFYSDRHNFNCLFNISPIAGKPFISEETRKKISLKNEGRWTGKKNPKFNSKRKGELNPFFGKKHKEENKKKQSEYMKKRWENGELKPHSVSDEQKEKLRKARTGTKASEQKLKKMSAFFKDRPNIKARKPIKQLDKNGNLIKIWDCARQAEKETGISASTISKCAKGKLAKGHPVLYAGGFKWEFVNAEDKNKTK